jgi:hypothetical protein
VTCKHTAVTHISILNHIHGYAILMASNYHLCRFRCFHLYIYSTQHCSKLLLYILDMGNNIKSLGEWSNTLYKLTLSLSLLLLLLLILCLIEYTQGVNV